MRLPNGYGSVYKLAGARRRPYAARKVVGWTYDEEKKRSYPKYVFIGFYRTRAEALEALADYNRDPYSLTDSTIGDVYDLWLKRKAPQVSEHTLTSYRTARRNLEPIAGRSIKATRLPEIQTYLDTLGTLPRATQAASVLRQLYDFAAKEEIIPTSQSDRLRYIDLSGLSSEKKVHRHVFTSKEIADLWSSHDDQIRASVLCLIFSGLRISEYLALKPSDFSDGCIHVRRSKTASGVRVVPIASRLAKIFTPESVPRMTYSRYRPKFVSAFPDHTVHDTRHTFISLCADKGIDERITKALVGHAGSGITETVYTHIDMGALRAAVDALCY